MEWSGDKAYLESIYLGSIHLLPFNLVSFTKAETDTQLRNQMLQIKLVCTFVSRATELRPWVFLFPSPPTASKLWINQQLECNGWSNFINTCHPVQRYNFCHWGSNVLWIINGIVYIQVLIFNSSCVLSVSMSAIHDHCQNICTRLWTELAPFHIPAMAYPWPPFLKSNWALELWPNKKIPAGNGQVP